MKVLCNLTTKKIEGFSRWDSFIFDSETHIEITVDVIPNFENDRLNDTNDGLRLVTSEELIAEAIIAKTELADIEVQFSQPEKALALVLLSELNILRVAAGLPERTVQQLKDAIETRL